MKERPMLFSGPMVRALLAGTKTQTRRVVKIPQRMEGFTSPAGALVDFDCPYGQPGDRLWVREACRAHEITDAEHDGVHLPNPGTDGVVYLADGAFREIENTPEASEKWISLSSYRGKDCATVPPIHMPRWASRITLEITNVRVERLQQISVQDALAEGVQREGEYLDMPRMAYKSLWEQINGAGSWDANPFVWVIEFRRAA